MRKFSADPNTGEPHREQVAEGEPVAAPDQGLEELVEGHSPRLHHLDQFLMQLNELRIHGFDACRVQSLLRTKVVVHRRQTDLR